MPGIYTGISGWRYPGWRGRFYPEGLAQRRELEYASRQLASIELNGSFYSLQRPSSYRRWHDETPDDFVFSIKGSRFITHTRRLREVERPLANFFASGLLLLKQKLGPFLWQFPANFKYDEELFSRFFSLLPRNTHDAARLARRHDERISGDRAWTRTDGNRPLRHAVEIRSHTFLDDAFVRLLRKHDVALVFADAAGDWPYAEDVTASFIYIRMHGAEERYVSGYTDAALDEWAAKISEWHQGGEPAQAQKIASLKPPRKARRDIYVYFDNDAKVKAPEDARKLMARLGVKPAGEEAKEEKKKREAPTRPPQPCATRSPRRLRRYTERSDITQSKFLSVRKHCIRQSMNLFQVVSRDRRFKPSNTCKRDDGIFI